MTAATPETGRPGTTAPPPRTSWGWDILGRYAPQLTVAVAFVASRWWAAAAGLRFDALQVHYGAQLADPSLLTDRLGETVWYLHSQPPLFNLGVGAVLKWSPWADEGTFHALFIVFGALITAGAFDLARQVGASPWWAAGIAIVVGASPVALLYESWLSYEVPVAAGLVWMAALAARWVRTANPWTLVAFTTVGSLVVLTRSLLHPVWLAAVIVLVVAARPPRRPHWRWLVALAIPLVLVGGIMVRNQVLFGSVSMSSWLGFNAHKAVVGTLDDDTRRQLIDEGVITPRPIEDCEVSRPGVPILANRYKESWRGAQGIENHNWECQIPYFDTLGAEAAAVARARPGHALRAAIGSAEIWANPATHYPPFATSRDQLGWLEVLHRRGAMATVDWDPPVDIPNAWAVQASSPGGRFGLSLTLVGSTVAVVAAGAVALIGWRRRGLGPARTAVTVGAVTVGYCAAVSILLEHAENNRIRYVSEPLTLALAAAIAVVLATRWWTARTRTPGLTEGHDDGDRPADGVPANS